MGVADTGLSDWRPAETPLVILAEGCFGEGQSKLALGVIRYGSWPVAAVIDSTRAGRTVRDVTGLPCDAPVVANLSEALSKTATSNEEALNAPLPPKALLIGTAPPGGQLPPEWRGIIKEAIARGLHVVNGLHFFLTDEPDLVALAAQQGVRLWDVRDPEGYGPGKFQVINRQLPRPENARVITMVGADCSVGKMHTSLELDAGARRRGKTSAFVATGQTGILIAGRGVPLDRVISDFTAGAMEVALHDEIHRLAANVSSRGEQACQTRQDDDIATIRNEAHWLFVEGQGALMHPAYAAVTLGLIHGSDPDAMILCHKAGATAIRHYEHLPLPPLRELIAQYEAAAAWVRPPGKAKAKVLGLSVNSSALPDDQARAYLAQLTVETGLPATDPVRYGVEILLDVLEKSLS